MPGKVLFYVKPYTVSYYASIPPEVPEALKRYGYDFIDCSTEKEFLELLPEAEVAVVAVFKPGWLASAPHLKWVGTFAAGKEGIPEKFLRERGLKVTFGRFHGRIMAETVVGMMLFAARGLGTAYRLQKDEPWCDKLLFCRLHTLRGKTCLILGLGNIGRHVARLTKAFGMRNIGVKRAPAGPEENVDRVIPLADWRKYLPEADHLVAVLPNAPETTDLIGSGELSLMKPTACLYNVGRGNCIDESALYEALRAGKIRWACLDVFKNEPLPMDTPLRSLDNILIMPHISAFAPEYFQLFFEEFLADFAEYVC
ncbi:MAG: D-2-hydroxyacid dehydrogenase [Bacillota bacterium]